jgi:hypothetical protein
LITKFSRIRVDFEFSDQNYSRSIFNINYFQSNNTLDFLFNYYNEKDDKNRLLAFSLTQEDKIVLKNAGDDLDNAFTSRTDSVVFSSDIILYKKVTAADDVGQLHEIFKYSSSPDSVYFNVQFSEVGTGRGNYMLLNTTANGRIYKWVSPVNGQLQGNYSLFLYSKPRTKKVWSR